MAKYKLIPYNIRVRKKREKEKYLNLDKIDLYTFLSKIMTKFSRDNQGFHDAKKKRILLTSDISILPKNKLIKGTIKIGDYGVSTDFVNMKTREIIKNFRKEHFSELFPYHFFIHFPGGRINDTAILLLQMKQNIGVKTFFEHAIRESFTQHYPDLMIEMNALITDDKTLECLIKAESIFEIKLIKTVVPNDVAERLGLENYKQITEVRSFKAPLRKGGIFFTKGKEAFTSMLLNEKVKLLEIGGVNYDNIVFRYKKDKQQRTIGLDDLEIKERMTVDEEKLTFENGFPTLESMNRHAMKYLEIVVEKVYQQRILSD
ncbi:MAG: hypothetical protein ACTSQE_10915 [Candidatus Heimdallarchaeaceae archaeon]